MWRAWTIGLLIAVLGVRGDADSKKKPPGKGFWKILVTPGAKWVLHDHFNDKDLTIETYDVRTIGKAQVARLRWTLGDDAEALKLTHAIGLTQVAVTDAGLYLLWASMDDAKVAEALKQKPARSDPPKAYKGTKLNEGRYLTIQDDRVCMGQDPLPEDHCDDCEGGAVCVEAAKGIVYIGGTWAPGGSEFAAPVP